MNNDRPRVILKKTGQPGLGHEFFGFYNIFGKFAAIVGPGVMALTTTMTGDARYSILAIIPLFIAGLLVFVTLPADKGTTAAAMSNQV